MDIWWICPMWTKCAFGDQKDHIWKKKDMPFGNPLIMGPKIADYFFTFMGRKVVFWVKKQCFRVFLTKWGSKPKAKKGNNRNGPYKQDTIVGITHIWP